MFDDARAHAMRASVKRQVWLTGILHHIHASALLVETYTINAVHVLVPRLRDLPRIHCARVDCERRK